MLPSHTTTVLVAMMNQCILSAFSKAYPFHHKSYLLPSHLLTSSSKLGDLTTSALVSPFIHEFSLDQRDSDCAAGARTLSASLNQPLRIEVGHEGIIGRRVTVWKQGGLLPLAEGIIGYN